MRIRLGRLSAWLVRPCSTHLAAAANNVGEKIAKLGTLLPLVAVLAVPLHGDIRLPASPGRWLLFAWALAVGAAISFSLDIIVSAGFPADSRDLRHHHRPDGLLRPIRPSSSWRPPAP